MDRRPSPLRSALAGLVALALALPAAPALGGDPKPSVALMGIHGSPQVGADRSVDVARWVALSLEDADAVEFRDLDQTGSAVVARRDEVLTGAFLYAARNELIGGQKLFEAARIDEATESLERARSLIDRWAEFLRDPDLVVDVYLYTGLCASWKGDAGEAERWFTLAAAIDPSRNLDPVRFPEDEIARFDRARDAVKAATPATVRIGPEAAGATVLVDGRPAGVAPVTLEVRPGKHVLTVLDARRGRATLAVEPASGEELSPRLDFSDAGLRPLAEADEPEGKQSRRTQALYEQLARAAGTDVLLLGGFDAAGNFRLQAYSRRDGRFSRPQVADTLLSQKGADDVVRRMVERLVSAVQPDGTLAADAVGTSMTPLYVGRDPVLNALLLGEGWSRPLGTGRGEPVAGGDSARATVVPVARRPLFWVLLGGGLAAAAAGVALGVTGAQGTEPPPSDTGVVTISFGARASR